MNHQNLNRIIPVRNEVENGFLCKVRPIVGSGERASVEQSEKREDAYIMHTPIASAEVSEDTDYELTRFYYRSLDAVSEKGLKEIAFPGVIIDDENYSLEDSVMVAVVSISSWMDENPDYAPQVFIVCHTDEVLDAYGKFISENIKYE